MLERIPGMLERVDLRKLYPEQSGSGARVVYLPCPAHGDEGRPNLAVYRANSYCFSCGFRESVLEHIKRVCGVDSTFDAMRVVERLLSDRPLTDGVDLTGKTPEPLNPGIATYYHDALMRRPDKVEWLCRKYGFSIQTIKEAALGYSGKAFTFPIYDVSGKLLNIRYRSDPAAEPDAPSKYWGVPGHNNRSWYLPPNLTHSGLTFQEVVEFESLERGADRPYVILTEGEADALALYQQGDVAISAVNGAQYLLRQHSTMLRDLQGLMVYVAYDQDEPGQEAADRLVNIMRSTGIMAVKLCWPYQRGKDASELLARGTSFWSVANFEEVAENPLTKGKGQRIII